MATSQIFISDNEKQKLFDQIRAAEKDKAKINYLLSAEYLEKICTGKTYLPDYAYGPLRSQLKKEYKE